MYTIRATLEDGEDLAFDCREGEDVLTAALRGNIILMSECHKGICTTCKALCNEGDFELGPGVNVYSLPPEDQEEGYTLLCQTYPTSDLELELPYGLDMVTFGSSKVETIHDVALIKLDHWTPNVAGLLLEARDAVGRPIPFEFRPGQYVNIRVPGTDEWRSFSMANSPDGSGHVELMVRLLDDGLFSNYLRNHARVGMMLEMKGPFGTFGLQESSSRPRLFVAGSTGLAPMVSMLRGMQGDAGMVPSKLVFGMRNKEYFFYASELAALSARNWHVELELALEEGHDGWTGRVGNVADALENILESNTQSPDVYICGPAAMVQRIEEICHGRGIPSGQIYTEKFLASG
ncbi:methane monooxygenase (plasmid) [Sphingobium sp. SCG-1]|uniref:FAD-binding oxidoreductase n=1 Tax=Sphingobium sp. SCG-1 TaxID=2072936 RepID=UPI000CD6C646|nr:2Fe-2S iron-sulfur cluster binding domain-containing protein [Sphingobium sp. SCG-1]AUW60477.1 methane monooxygenase [Sphingobium sp. SCG-1]AUW60642.1 methane monooxygenase [Sphingobium sp. SCG-1]